MRSSPEQMPVPLRRLKSRSPGRMLYQMTVTGS